MSSAASPRLVSERTSFQPAGASMDPADPKRTSIAASITSPATTPEGFVSVIDRTLRSVVLVDVPCRDGDAAVAISSETDAAAP